MRIAIWMGGLVAFLSALVILGAGLVIADFAVHGVKGGGTWAQAATADRLVAVLAPIVASVPLLLWAWLTVVLVNAKPIGKTLLWLCCGTALIVALSGLGLASVFLTDPDIWFFGLPLAGYPVGTLLMLNARRKSTVPSG